MAELQSATIDLGNDPEQTTFILNGRQFTCFPMDEIDSINDVAESHNPPLLGGEKFLEIVQERLRSKHGVTASRVKAADWYQALHLANEGHKDFFAESPASSAATGSSQSGLAGEVSHPQPTGQQDSLDSSKPSRTKSKQKK